MCQIVSRPAGREARSPGLSVSAGPPAISMVTSPSSTWIVSRWDGVHGVGPATAVNRVSPAHTPSARTSSCISLPGTSGSGSHSSVLTFEQNTPGCGSITTLLPASAGQARLSRRGVRPARDHTTPKDAGPRPDRTESVRSAHTGPENGSRPVTGVRPRPVRAEPPLGVGAYPLVAIVDAAPIRHSGVLGEGLKVAFSPRYGVSIRGLVSR